ncbi:facilitated trehalose transporter Tret1-like [Homalodisca vitripennis]|uniref:facilitated trehalose transporter Tret1-like n=1 Tax=Homalodisca vitripennis TaxID=197043 RepID=UPI001EEB678A|nr:facilitated trehalose transporter Tret1-like [Homalodisca vitripennis]
MFTSWTSTLPITRARCHQFWAAVTVNIGIMIGGEYYGWPSPTIPKLTQPNAPLCLHHSEITWMVCALYLGNILSPIPTGYFMDRFGRKRSLIYCSILPISSWVLIWLATSLVHLHVARFLGGLWVGVITTIAPMYTGEIAEPKIRGALGNMFSFMTYVGTLYVYSIGPYVSYHTLAITAGVVPIYFLTMMFSIPESPYYFLIRNDREGAKKSLRWLRGGMDNHNLELEVDKMEEVVLQQMKNTGSIAAIFTTRTNRKAFLIVQLYAIFTKFSGMGLIIAFSSTTLPKTMFESAGASECAVILASVWVISSGMSMILVDRLGRKTLLTGTSLGCSITMFSAGFWFYLSAETEVDVEGSSWIPFVSFIFHGLFYCLGFGPIGTSIKGELLSADIRASASALTTVVLALSSLFLNFIYIPAADHIGMYFNYWLFSASSIICTVFTICAFVETNGKTLQEIQDQLAR